MQSKALTGMMLLAALFSVATPASAQQQTTPIARPSDQVAPVSPRRRIEINPRPLLYRRCVDWYALQNRPSGTVLYPQMRCWWVRG
jgi:hypothetical protein